MYTYPFSHNHGSMENGCISNRIVTFQISRHYPLNHDYGRKGTCFTPSKMCLTPTPRILGSSLGSSDVKMERSIPFFGVAWRGVHVESFRARKSGAWSKHIFGFFLFTSKSKTSECAQTIRKVVNCRSGPCFSQLDTSNPL